jgi:anti-sigma regulatory factor (Ser/Thr protein kinase)
MAVTSDEGGGTVTRWNLPHDLSSASQARDLVRTALAGLASVDDAVLIASELVVNAVDHGSPPVVLEVTRTATQAVIAVENAGTAVPQPQPADPDASRGRGLGIVAGLAADWGWSASEDTVRVWAAIPSV